MRRIQVVLKLGGLLETRSREGLSRVSWMRFYLLLFIYLFFLWFGIDASSLVAGFKSGLQCRMHVVLNLEPFQFRW